MNPTESITIEIINTINTWKSILQDLNLDYINTKRNNQNRTTKEILGHLIDSASNNHQRFVRLQYNENLIFPDYRQDNDLWIKIQNHNNENWDSMILTWYYMNAHIAHVINNIDAKHLNNSWRDYEGNHVTLLDMIKYYIVHIRLHLSEIENLMKIEVTN